MKVPIDFRDDHPWTARDWDRLNAPARSWRHDPTPHLSVRETAKAGVIGFVMAIIGLAFLILGFVL